MPGPGSYDYEASSITKKTSSKLQTKDGKSTGFGTQTRNTIEVIGGRHHDMPGPGSYSYVEGMSYQNKQRSVVVSQFGKEERLKSHNQGLPGPGNYEVRSSLNKQGIKIAGRYNQGKMEEQPGPGNYEIEMKTSAFKHSQTQSKMSKAARLTTQKTDHPGPGMYESHSTYSFTKAKTSNFVFGT